MYGGSMCPVIGVTDVSYVQVLTMPPRTFYPKRFTVSFYSTFARCVRCLERNIPSYYPLSLPGKCGRYGGYGSSGGYGGGYGGYGGYGGMSSMYGGYGGSMYGGSMYGSGSWF